MVLATVRAITRITSYSDAQSRLLLFILLNSIYASKRVTPPYIGSTYRTTSFTDASQIQVSLE